MLKVQLIVVQGKPEGKTIPLDGPLFRIGRGETCHLRPNSEQVSREHAEIRIAEGQVLVRDLGSRNGTLVNGKPIKAAHRLKNGELLQVGPLTFAVSIQGATEAASPMPAPAGKAKSLDDISNAEIESWLIADVANPTPDRPSGVYGGETVTVGTYQEAQAAKPPSGQAIPTSTAAPTAPAAAATPPTPPRPAPAAPARPAPSAPAAPARTAPAAGAGAGHFLDDLEIEALPEGEGDADETVEDEESHEDAAGGVMPEEFIDESNPFYAARKAVETAPAKPSYKDSSDAASDILRKMMDRRRPR